MGMKQELSSLDLHFLVKEFKILETGRIDKIYQWGKDEFVIRAHTKEGKKHLRIKLPSLVFFTEKSYEAPIRPPGYCEFLRKYISNAIIRKVEQKDFERILEITLEKKETFKLIIELIKPGNIILVKDNMIMSPLNQEKFKDRTVRAKQEYVYPPSRFNVKKEDPSQILKESSKIIVKTLATDMGFGGIYAEEILARANVDKNLKSTEVETEPISKEINNIFKEKINSFSLEKEVFPIEMKTKEGEPLKTFNEAIDSITPQIKSEKLIDDSVKKQEVILKMQRKRLTELEKELEEAQKAGEYIYEHYKEFEALLNNIKELRKTKTFKEIKPILKTNKHFKELNEKEKKIILEF